MLAQIDARLNTTMWRRGAERAHGPWAVAYTADPAVIEHYRRTPVVIVREPQATGGGQDFDITVVELPTGFTPAPWVDPATVDPIEDYDTWDGAMRYLGQLTGDTAAQVAKFEARLRAWDGS